MSTQSFAATGRRKNAIAKVWIRPGGTGQITINGMGAMDYLNREVLVQDVERPLLLTENRESVDVIAKVLGGGKSGQAGALRLGIARALVLMNENDRPALRAEGFLTRDARMVERKKYGQKGARGRFQFSKR
jgi:small subunit ribosomal protein S9